MRQIISREARAGETALPFLSFSLSFPSAPLGLASNLISSPGFGTGAERIFAIYEWTVS
jgi:hypothetical protein